MLIPNPFQRPSIRTVLDSIKSIRKDLGLNKSEDEDFDYNPVEDEGDLQIFDERRIESTYNFIDKIPNEYCNIHMGQLKDSQSLQTYRIYEIVVEELDDANAFYIEMFNLSKIKFKNMIKMTKFVKQDGKISGSKIFVALTNYSTTLAQYMVDRNSKVDLFDYGNSTLGSLMSNSNYYDSLFPIEDLSLGFLNLAEGVKCCHDHKMFFHPGDLTTDRIFIRNETLYIDFFTSKIEKFLARGTTKSSNLKPSEDSDIISMGIIFYEMYTLKTYSPMKGKEIESSLKLVKPFNRRLSKMIKRMIDPDTDVKLPIEEIIRKLKLIHQAPNNEEEKDTLHRMRRKSKEFISGLVGFFDSSKRKSLDLKK
jgi:hypothetical protein